LRHLHISFTHDGNAVIALAAHAPELRGVGIDVVRLARLAGRGRDYLERFARHFMSDCEFETFLKHSSDESEEAMIRRAAAHFSLMEAASKALGTGLKIGGGMGKPESLPKRSVNARVSGLGSRVSEWEVEFDLESDAMERIRVLKASRVEGYVSADSEYLVSAAFLMV
jgi:phosphopantetheinyl transferase (holo-ACP synthase)